MMTTLDAPHWLRGAREYNEGLLEGDRLRNYPDYLEIVDQSPIPNNFKDPSNPGDLFSERHSVTSYENFRTKINS